MNEEHIFDAALAKGDPAERAAYLDEMCAGDPGLRRRVEALLQSHQEAGSFLEQPALGPPANSGNPGDAGGTPTEPFGDGEFSLSFLSPPRRPDALGRLKHFEVLEVVGRGGMGVVLKAFDESLQRVVAIKVMAPQLAVTASARKRFIREAHAAAAVRDEHVVDIHAVDEADGLPYLVMEYVSGISLQERLDKGGPLEVKEVLRIGVQTAAGLAAAHKQGLIHRDIKPANILLENGVQRVKITDFGLARAVDDASLTQSGMVAGTPQYMAPEQARGEPVDHRADLFSLGSVLYAMCTGHPPFRAGSSLAVLKRVSEDTPRPVRQINPDVSDSLSAIIDRLHAKDPAARFQSADEVADLLGQRLANLQQPGHLPMPRPSAGPPAPTHRTRRRWAVAAAAVLALGALATTEVTGVTRVREYVATVLRIRTAEGTLVVEVNDPGVKVTIDGDGDEVVIAGAGPQEVRLRPGHYHVRASKDGVPVALDNELVTITRDGKQVVRVSREAVGAAPTRPPLRLRATLRGEGIFSRIAFSPDGSVLASAQDDGRVILWDVASAQLKMALEGHKPLATAVAFSRDGKLLASASGDWRQPLVNGEVRVWDALTGKLRFARPSSAGPVSSVAFAPDGKTVAAGDRAAVQLWDAATGKQQAPLKSGAGARHALAYAADGKTLAVSVIDVVELWDMTTRRRKGIFAGHLDEIETVAFSPDGTLLATGSRDRTVKLWDVATRKERLTLTGHPHWVRSVAFSPDALILASACHGNVAKLWDVAPGRLLLDVPRTGLTAGSVVAFTRDGDTLAVGGNGTIRLWDVSAVGPKPRAGTQPTVGRAPPAPARLEPRATIHGGAMSSVAFSREGDLLAISSGTTIQVWDQAAREHRFNLRGHRAWVWTVAFSPDGKTLASASMDHTIKLWDLTRRQERATLEGHTDKVWSVAFSPDGRTLVSTSDDRSVRLWDVATGKPQKLLGRQDIHTYDALFTTDGQTVVSADVEGDVRLWDVASGRLVGHLDGHTAVVRLALTADGKTLATASHDLTVKLWDIATRQLLRTLRGHTLPIERVAFSPDGKLLATVSGDFQKQKTPGEVKLWDVASGTELGSLTGHGGPVHGVAFTPDGQTLASASADGTVLLWDISRLAAPPRTQVAAPPAAPHVRATLEGHTSWVWSVAFAPGGRTLASASRDGTVKLWKRHTEAWREEATLDPQAGPLRCVAFAPDAKTLAAAAEPGTVQLWRWDGTAWRTGRTLKGHKDYVYWLAFSPDGTKLASVGGAWPAAKPGEVKVWDANSGQVLASLEGHRRNVNGVTFSPAGETLATAGADGTVRLWNAKTWKPLASLPGPDGFNGVCFSPDGKTLAAGCGDRSVWLWKWDGTAWRRDKTLRTHEGPVWGVAFSRDGKVLASAGFDKTVRLYDPTTGDELAILRGHGQEVLSVAFSADNLLATASWDGTVKLWDWAASKAGEGRAEHPAYQPFVVLARGGAAEQPFATLAEAVASAASGDTIQVCGDGPFVTRPITINAKPLTIRAGHGCQPIIRLAAADAATDAPLFWTNAELLLEGLRLERISKNKVWKPGMPPYITLWSVGAPLHAVNCLFSQRGGTACVYAAKGAPVCDLRNCAFLTPDAAVWWWCESGGRLSMVNCLHNGFHSLVVTYRGPLRDVAIQLKRNTFAANEVFLFCLVAPGIARDAGPDAHAISWHASENVFCSLGPLLQFLQTGEFLANNQELHPHESKDLLRRLVRWHDDRNAYAPGSQYVVFTKANHKEAPGDFHVLSDWLRYWGIAESHSLPQSAPAGFLARLRPLAAEKVSPDAFRLGTDSPGYRCGKGGGDLGADVDLVGPGAAYERWQKIRWNDKSPEYRQWLTDAEDKAPAPRPPAAGPPFVILARGSQPEQPYDSLGEAVANARAADTIEVRGDGPFRIGKAGVRIDRALTIRAASGCRPVLQMVSTEAGEERSKCLIEARAPLTLEGLTFDRTGRHEAHGMNMGALIVHGGPLHMSNCQLLTPRSYFVVWLSGVASADVRHCQFQSESAAPIVVENFKAGYRLGVSDCLFGPGWSSAVVINPNQGGPASASVQVRVAHNTFARPALGWYRDSTFQKIEVEAQGNVVVSSPVLLVRQPWDRRQAPAPKAWQDLVRKVRWSGRQNLYPADRPLVELEAAAIKPLSGLDSWNRLWGRAEQGSRAATVKFTGGAGPHHPAAAADIGFWRLLPDSPGHAAAEDRHDLGADVDLVGPGAPYEWWKKSAEYRQWLKDAGAANAGR
jgi:WD40 repeat protein